jgi:hypothetical protein
MADRLVKIFHEVYVKPHGSLPCTQQSSTVHYSEPNDPDQILKPYFLKNILILSSLPHSWVPHVCSSFKSFLIKLSPLMRSKYSTYPTLLDLTSLVISQVMKFLIIQFSSALCYFHPLHAKS